MKTLFAFFISLPLTAAAQINDNFSDGNFTSNPKWSGNDTDFVVNANQQLQLNSSGSSASYLSLSNTQPLANCQWSFWVNLNFSPSSSNYSRIYLVSDTNDLSGNVNGYYLQLGETGANDRVRLFKQTGNISDTVCSGTTIIANAFAIRVKVTRDNSGFWKLFVDPTGGTNYNLEASGIDNTFKYTTFFGIYCSYTSANATKFFFDDFSVVAPPDIAAPNSDSLALVSANQIDVYFDEVVSLSSAQTPANYSVYPNIGYPSSATRDATDHTLVHLTFPSNLSNGQQYTLTVTGVQDLAGNTDINDTTHFLFFVPQQNDIVINEIMADPDPVVSLPDYEYVELYNRAKYPARLNGWSFTSGSYTKYFPDIILQPDSFLILCKDSARNYFLPFGQTAAIFTSSSTLTNSGTTLVLRDGSGNIIHSVAYSDTWYQDPIKINGGWSLEQMDPNSPCGGKVNWRASADVSGGTPGRKNSVFASVPDVAAPKVAYVTVLSSTTVRVFFSEYLDSTTLTLSSNYSIDNGMGNPASVSPVGPDYMSAILTLPSIIMASTVYTITMNGIKDCAGNTLAANTTAVFAIAETAAPNDIVLNEILFDPFDNGVEWVEIYNRSNKIIDLKQIYLCSQDNGGSATSINQIAPGGRLMLPKEYLVLSKDQGAIKTQYTTTNTEGFVDMASAPSLSNDSDYVQLIDPSYTVIDKLHYYSSWHLPLISDTKGISLERINYDNPTQDANNWHSASQSLMATPAYKNSEYATGEESSEITISPEVFSPDNDGYNDVLSISYSFSDPGMIANVHIYDSRGRLTKTLIRNELLAASGTFFWDGITDEKTKARVGIYVIYVEAFDNRGGVKKIKKSCVVGGKL